MLPIKNTSSFIKNKLQSKLQLPFRTFNTKTRSNMPLVVPGITSGGDKGDKTKEWTDKLVGKKIGEASDATV